MPLAAPASPEMGDVASPVAMALAKAARRPPREIAEAIAARLADRPGAADWLAGVEVAGPGFLNMTLTPSALAGAVAGVGAAGDRYGAGSAATPMSVLLEFFSANPTGPPHVGHARHGAYGDSLARILAFAGHRVTREYYVNDHGRQMRTFGASVAARYAQLCGREVEVPEDGYQGDYVVEIAAAVREEIGDDWADAAAALDPEVVERFSARGEELMLQAIRDDLARFRVSFDAFFSERTLHAEGRVAAGVAALETAGDAYRAEGALWFRTSAYGDEKDRVLVRGDGETTYLASDVAYHLDKAGRGYDLLIDVLGADHHGYVARLHAVLAAGGYDPALLEVLIVQLVNLLERGEAKKMSKRAGTLVTLGDLMDDIGVERGPLLPGAAQPRDPPRPGSRPGAQPEPGEPGLLRPVRPRAGVQHPGPGGRPRHGRRPPHPGPRRARPGRALARDAAHGLAGGRVGGGGAPCAASGGRLSDRAGQGVPRLLPPMPGGGGAARRRGLPPRPLPGHRNDDPNRPRPPRRGGPGAHVGAPEGW